MGVTREQVIEYLSDLRPDALQDLIVELEDRWSLEPVAPAQDYDYLATMGPAIEMGMPLRPLVLQEVGPNRIQVMKLVRQITAVGLREAKTLIDGVPAQLLDDIDAQEAWDLIQQFSAIGARVELG